MSLRLIAALALVLATGCTTTCRIDSNIHGAQVYLDGSLKGLTPCEVELDDNTRAYTLRLEHPECHPFSDQITQQYSGTVTQQQTQTNVTGQTNAYASPSGRSASTYTTAQGTQSTQTQQYHMYAWPTRYFCRMHRKVGASTEQTSPPPQSRPAASAPPPSPPPPPPSRPAASAPPPAPPARRAFCGSCGQRLDAGARFCGACGERIDGQ